MKYSSILILIVIILVMGCTPKETPKEPTQQTTEPEKQTRVEKPSVIEKPITEPEQEIEPEVKEEPTQKEKPEINEDEQLQKIFDYPKTKIQSYSYRYKDPSGRQYNIHVKENKIMIDYISDDYKIYLDTEKKTAEEWCISHTKCGRETGKIADLDYYNTYIETPLDWLEKITDAKKISEGFYYGKKGFLLNTNIGEVIIDSNFGFVYGIKQEIKEYSFTDASFNTVKDEDVNVPEYLLSE